MEIAPNQKDKIATILDDLFLVLSEDGLPDLGTGRTVAV